MRLWGNEMVEDKFILFGKDLEVTPITVHTTMDTRKQIFVVNNAIPGYRGDMEIPKPDKMYDSVVEATDARMEHIARVAPQTPEEVVCYPLTHQIIPNSIEEAIYIYAMRHVLDYKITPSIHVLSHKSVPIVGESFTRTWAVIK